MEADDLPVHATEMDRSRNTAGMAAPSVMRFAFSIVLALLAERVAAQGGKEVGAVVDITWIVTVCVSFSVWILFLLFYDARVLGTIVTRAAKKFYFPKDSNVHFSVSAISIHLFSGQIKFRRVHYADVDQGLLVQDGSITIRYWSRRYRRHADDIGKERMLVLLNGLGYHIYNNSKRYTNLAKVFKLDESIFGDDRPQKQKSDTSKSNKTPEAPPPGVPAFLKVFPVIRIRILAGRIVAGNRSLPGVLVTSFRGATCSVSTEKDSEKDPTQIDPYVFMASGKLKEFRLRMVPSFTFKFTNFINEEVVANSLVTDKTRSKRKRQKPLEWGWKTSELGFVFKQTTPTLVTAENLGSAPPIAQIELTSSREVDVLWESSMTWQASALIRFLSPWDYQDVKAVPEPKIGDLRAARGLSINMRFKNDCRVGLWYKGPDMTEAELNVPKCELNNANTELSIGCDEAEVDIWMPYLLPKDGYTTTVKSRFEGNVNVDFSLPCKTFIENCDVFSLDLDMFNPMAFDDTVHWTYRVKLESPTIRYLDLHKALLTKFFGSLGAPAQPFTESDAQPIVMTFDVQINDFNLLLNVNDNNLIHHIDLPLVSGKGIESQPLQNCYMMFSGDSLTVNWINDFPAYSCQVYKDLYNIDIGNIQMRLILPAWDTNAFLDASFTRHHCWQVEKLKVQVATYFNDDMPGITDPTARGKLVENRDSVSLKLDFYKVRGNLTGQIISKIRNLLSNYTGGTRSPTFWVANHAVNDRKRESTMSSSSGKFLRFERLTDPSAPRASYELLADVNFHDADFSLPERLYGVHGIPRMRLLIPKISIGVWFDDYRMDIHVVGKQLQICKSRHHKVPEPKSSIGSLMVTDYGVHIAYAYDFDFEKAQTVYYGTMQNIQIGNIKSTLSTLDVVALSEWGSSVGYHMKNVDNYVPPPEDFLAEFGKLQERPVKISQANSLSPYTTLRLRIETFDLVVRSMNADTMLQVAGSEGIQITSDTQIREGSSSLMKLSTGSIQLRQLLKPTSSYIPRAFGIDMKTLPSDRMLVVASLKTSLSGTIHEPIRDWHSMSKSQAVFLSEIDRPHLAILFVQRDTTPKINRKWTWKSATRRIPRNRRIIDLQDLPWLTPLFASIPSRDKLQLWNGSLFAPNDVAALLLRVEFPDPVALHTRPLRMTMYNDLNSPHFFKGDSAISEYEVLDCPPVISNLQSTITLPAHNNSKYGALEPIVEHESPSESISSEEENHFLGGSITAERLQQFRLDQQYISRSERAYLHSSFSDKNIDEGEVDRSRNQAIESTSDTSTTSASGIEVMHLPTTNEVDPSVNITSAKIESGEDFVGPAPRNSTEASAKDVCEGSVSGVFADTAENDGVQKLRMPSASWRKSRSENPMTSAESRIPSRESTGRLTSDGASDNSFVSATSHQSNSQNSASENSDSFVSATDDQLTDDQFTSADDEGVESDSSFSLSSSSHQDDEGLTVEKMESKPEQRRLSRQHKQSQRSSDTNAVDKKGRISILTKDNIERFTSSITASASTADNMQPSQSHSGLVALVSEAAAARGRELQDKMAATQQARKQFRRLANKVMATNVIAAPVVHSRKFRDILKKNVKWPNLFRTQAKISPKSANSKKLREHVPQVRYHEVLGQAEFCTVPTMTNPPGSPTPRHVQSIVDVDIENQSKKLPPEFETVGKSQRESSWAFPDMRSTNENGEDDDLFDNSAKSHINVTVDDSIQVLLTPLAASGANNIIDELYQHMAKMGIKNLWMQELEKLQKNYMGPEQVTDVDSTTSVSKIQVSIPVINVTVAQDGWFGSISEESQFGSLHRHNTGIKTQSPQKLSGISILASQLRELKLGMSTRNLCEALNGRLHTTTVQAVQSVSFSALQVELYTPPHILPTSSDLPVQFTANLLLPEDQLLDRCLLQMTVGATMLSLQSQELLETSDDPRNVGIFEIGVIEIEAIPVAVLPIAAATASWTIVTSELSSSLTAMAEHTEATRRRMFGALFTSLPLRRKASNIAMVDTEFILPWHGNLSLAVAEYVHAQRFAPKLARSVQKTLKDDYNRILLLDFFTSVRAASKAFEDDGSNSLQSGLIPPPWFPAAEVATRLSLLIEGYISNTDLVNPYGLSQSIRFTSVNISEVDVLIKETDEIQHHVSVKEAVLTAKSHYFPFIPDNTPDDFDDGNLDYRPNAQIKVSGNLRVTNVVSIFNPSLVNLGKSMQNEMGIGAEMIKFHVKRQVEKESNLQATSKDLHTQSMVSFQTEHISSTTNDSISFPIEHPHRHEISSTTNLNDSQANDGDADKIRPMQHASSTDYSHPVDRRSQKRTLSGSAKQGKSGGWRKRSQKRFQEPHDDMDIGVIPALSQPGSLTTESCVSFVIYLNTCCDNLQVGTGSNSSTIEILATSLTVGLEHASDKISRLNKSATVERISSQRKVDVVSAAIGVDELRFELVNSLQKKSHKNRGKRSRSGGSNGRKQRNREEIRTIMALVTTGIKALVSQHKSKTDFFLALNYVEFSSIRSVADAETFLLEMFKIWQEIAAPVEVVDNATSNEPEPQTQIDKDRLSPDFHAFAIRIIVKSLTTKTSVLSAVRLLYNAQNIEVLALVNPSSSEIRAGLSSHRITFASHEKRGKLGKAERKQSSNRSKLSSSSVKAPSIQSQSRANIDVKVPLPPLGFLQKSVVDVIEIGDPGFSGYAGPIQVSRVRLLIKRITFTFSNALLNEAVIYQELFANDIGKLSAIFERISNTVQSNMKSARRKSEIPDLSDPRDVSQNPISSTATQMEAQIRFTGIMIALHSSNHSGQRQDGLQAPEGFVCYTNAIQAKFNNSSHPRQNSRFHTEMSPIVYFGQFPHDYTEEVLQQKEEIGSIQLELIVLGRTTVDKDQTTNSTIQITLNEPSAVVPWQSIAKVVMFGEDFRFFYEYYRQDLKQNLSKEASQMYDALKTTATDKAKKKAEEARSKAGSDKGSIKFEIRKLLVRLLLDDNMQSGATINTKPFLVGSLLETGLTLGDQASRSIGAFEQLRIGFIETDLKQQMMQFKTDKKDSLKSGFIRMSGLRDKLFRDLLKREHGVNVCVVPRGSIRLFTSKVKYSTEEAIMRSKESKSVIAFIGQIGTDDEKISVALDSNIGKFAKLGQGTMDKVNGRLALIDRSRSTMDTQDVVMRRQELGQAIVILEHLHSTLADEVSIDYQTAQVLAKKRELKRMQRESRRKLVSSLSKSNVKDKPFEQTKYNVSKEGSIPRSSSESIPVGRRKVNSPIRAASTFDRRHRRAQLSKAMSNLSGRSTKGSRGSLGSRGSFVSMAERAGIGTTQKSAETGTTEFEFDWSIDIKGGEATLYMDEDIINSVSNSKSDSLSPSRVPSPTSPRVSSLDDEERQFGALPRRQHDRRLPQAQRVPIPQVILNVAYQPANLAYVQAAQSESYLGGQLHGMLSVNLEDATFSPASLLFARVTAKKFKSTRTVGLMQTSRSSNQASDDTWDSGALLESLPLTYSFHVHIGRRNATTKKQSSIITLNCAPHSDTSCQIVLPAFKMHLSSGTRLASTNSASDAAKTDVALRSVSIWLNQLRICIAYANEAEKKKQQRDAFLAAVHNISLCATLETPAEKQKIIEATGRTAISVLCEVGQIEGSVDTTQSNELQTFRHHWDPRKLQLLTKQSESSGMGGRHNSGIFHSDDENFDALNTELSFSDETTTSTDEASTDDESDDLEDEVFEDENGKRPIVVFGLVKVDQVNLTANLGKVLGMLQFNMQKTMGRGAYIDRRPAFVTGRVKIDQISLDDGGAHGSSNSDISKIASSNRKASRQGIIRGRLLASNLAGAVSKVTPPSHPTTLPSSTARMEGTRSGPRICVSHAHLGIRELDAKLNYLSTLILVLRLVDTQLQASSNWHPDVQDRIHDPRRRYQWLNHCPVAASWNTFDCVLTKDTAPLLMRVSERFSRAIKAQTEDLMGTHDSDDRSESQSQSNVTAEVPPVEPVPGVVTLMGKHARVTLFKNNFSESGWVFIDLSTFKMVFNQLDPGVLAYSRIQTVSFTAGSDGDSQVAGSEPFLIANGRWKRGSTAYLSAETSVEGWCRELRTRSTISVIFSIPRMSLETSTFVLRRDHSVQVLSRFESNFDGGFGVTTDVNHFISLNNLVSAYRKKFAQGMQDTAGATSSTRAPPKQQSSDLMTSSSSDTESETTNGPALSSTTKYTFLCLPRVIIVDDESDALSNYEIVGTATNDKISILYPDAWEQWKTCILYAGDPLLNSPHLAAQLLAAEVVLSPRFTQTPHSDVTCDFKFKPRITPISVGNLTPPSLDWVMKNFFQISDPHTTFNESLYHSVNFGLAVPLDAMHNLPRPPFASTTKKQAIGIRSEVQLPFDQSDSDADSQTRDETTKVQPPAESNIQFPFELDKVREADEESLVDIGDDNDKDDDEFI